MRRVFVSCWLLLVPAACAPATDLTRIPASGVGSPALAVRIWARAAYGELSSG